jgi:flagellar motility protein MotE (MotC chaperone)
MTTKKPDTKKGFLGPADAGGDGDGRRRAWPEGGRDGGERRRNRRGRRTRPSRQQPQPRRSHGQEPAAAAATQHCEAPTLADMAGLSQAEVQVLQALGTRRAELDARGVAMETQDGLMLAAEQRLSERLAELRTLETHVNDLLGQLDQAQEQRLRELVGVYERMRARDAAAVFDGLEDDVLVQVASRMRQANLAEVMGRMDPNRARALTQMLADRARPPTSGGNLLERARGDASASAP